MNRVDRESAQNITPIVYDRKSGNLKQSKLATVRITVMSLFYTVMYIASVFALLNAWMVGMMRRAAVFLLLELPLRAVYAGPVLLLRSFRGVVIMMLVYSAAALAFVINKVRKESV